MAAVASKASTVAVIMKGTAAKLAAPVLVAGTAITGLVACGKLFLLLADYAQWFNKVQPEWEKKLQSAQDELKEMERKIQMC